MSAVFTDEGICFQYPENWLLEREDTEDGWTVAVQSPATAFLLLSMRTDLPSIEEMANTALEALRDDYPELEAEECTESFAGLPAVGHDIRFFKFDLTNTCWTRSFYTPQGTVLVFCQTSDLEPEKNELVLRAICASMKVEDE